MAEPDTTTFDSDALAKSIEVGERFDAVNWKQFNGRDLDKRNETRIEVLDIRKDLLKVAATDPQLAARVWDEHVPTYVPRPPELTETEREPQTVNSIEPGRRRRRTAAEPFLDPSEEIGVAQPQRGRNQDPPETPAEPKARATEPGQSKAPETPKREDDDPKAERARMLLEGLERQYLKADDKYHFRDRGREVAFEAQEKKLVTAHDTPSVVSSMIDLAEAKGWSSLKLTGTNEFKREAWLQANLRDLEVSGYRPNAVDRARLEELKAERGGQPSADRANVVADVSPTGASRDKRPEFKPLAETEAHEPPLALTKPQDQAVSAMEVMMRSRGDSQRAISMARAELTERLRSDRVHVGTLVEVGTGAYQDRPGEKMSHFVTLEDDKGQRSKVWGVDLPRALEASRAQPGEKIALAFKGRQTVTVDDPVRDENGKTIRFEKKEVDRNTWEIVGFDRLRDEAKTRVTAAAERAHRPADLRVFDRAAPRSEPQPTATIPRERSRERAR